MYHDDADQHPVAGNGLLHRRHLLGLGLAGAGSMLTLGSGAALASSPVPLIQPWQRSPGPGPSAYGQPSAHVGHIQRLHGAPNPNGPGIGASRTPLHQLHGTITPNSLHFERHHAGVPAIDPAQHQLVIHGLVRQPLVFSYEALLAYPMISRVYYIECSGNSGANSVDTAPAGTAGSLHGLLSCSEWTGVSLATLLDQAGVLPEARWVNATGADSASMGRAIPLRKALDDVLVALYQNGEPVRPEQGYPMRLLVPGWEGNVSVKWLTQLQLSNQPANFKDETSRYTDLLPDGRSLQFTFPMGVKSVITHPSGQMQLARQGVHFISGLAWSGHGGIRRVEVSADGGQTWADAALQAANDGMTLTRFSLPWRWDGSPAILQSRAIDNRGNVQPTRTLWRQQYGPSNRYHYNAIQSWAVATSGEVSNVFV